MHVLSFLEEKTADDKGRLIIDIFARNDVRKKFLYASYFVCVATLLPFDSAAIEFRPSFEVGNVETSERVASHQNVYGLELRSLLPEVLIQKLNCEAQVEGNKHIRWDCKPENRDSERLSVFTTKSNVIARIHWTFAQKAEEQIKFLRELEDALGPPDIFKQSKVGWESRAHIKMKWGGPAVDAGGRWYKSPNAISDPLVLDVVAGFRTHLSYEDRNLMAQYRDGVRELNEYWQRLETVFESLLYLLPTFIGYWLALRFWRDEIMNMPEVTRVQYLKYGTQSLVAVGVISLVVGSGGQSCVSQGLRGCEEYSNDYYEAWSLLKTLDFFVRTGVGVLAGLFVARRSKQKA